MTTYIHATRRDARGHYRPSSWHVVKLHTRGINTWLTLCGRLLVTTDTMEELPAAKSCESCLRIEARRDDREDDASTSPVDPVTDTP